MIIALFVFASFLVATVIAIAVKSTVGRHLSSRDERRRLEFQISRAERELHRIASDAFIAMVDLARESTDTEQWRR